MISDLAALLTRRDEFKAYLGRTRDIDVDRQEIVSCVLKEYRKDPYLVHSNLNVYFQGEVGVDADGLTREMFQLFFSQVVKAG